MINFLEISKKNITVLENMPIHINAHFITDTSQSWIFSNIKKEEGICDVYIHYISAENNRKMMKEQPLWRGYINREVANEEMKEELLKNICQPVIHVILNVHTKYKDFTQDLINFIYGILRKNNPDVEEILIETFIYTEVLEVE